MSTLERESISNSSPDQENLAPALNLNSVQNKQSSVNQGKDDKKEIILKEVKINSESSGIDQNKLVSADTCSNQQKSQVLSDNTDLINQENQSIKQENRNTNTKITTTLLSGEETTSSGSKNEGALNVQDEGLELGPKPTSIYDALEISRKVIFMPFGFPGQILEENLDVRSISNYDIQYMVHVVCDNQEFDDLDEYVLSVRRFGGYDYNDRYLILQNPQLNLKFKIAIKVPNIHNEQMITGKVKIFSEQLIGSLTVEIRSPVNQYLNQVVKPTLVAKKMMLHKTIDTGFLHYLMKSPKQSDFKLSLQNKSRKAIEVGFLVIKNKEVEELFNMKVHPQLVNFNPNSTVVTNIQVSRNPKVSEDPELLSKLEKMQSIRIIVLGKVRNSSAIFSFPCVISFRKNHFNKQRPHQSERWWPHVGVAANQSYFYKIQDCQLIQSQSTFCNFGMKFITLQLFDRYEQFLLSHCHPEQTIKEEIRNSKKSFNNLNNSNQSFQMKYHFLKEILEYYQSLSLIYIYEEDQLNYVKFMSLSSKILEKFEKDDNIQSSSNVFKNHLLKIIKLKQTKTWNQGFNLNTELFTSKGAELRSETNFIESAELLSYFSLFAFQLGKVSQSYQYVTLGIYFMANAMKKKSISMNAQGLINDVLIWSRQQEDKISLLEKSKLFFTLLLLTLMKSVCLFKIGNNQNALKMVHLSLHINKELLKDETMDILLKKIMNIMGFDIRNRHSQQKKAIEKHRKNFSINVSSFNQTKANSKDSQGKSINESYSRSNNRRNKNHKRSFSGNVFFKGFSNINLNEMDVEKSSKENKKLEMKYLNFQKKRPISYLNLKRSRNHNDLGGYFYSNFEIKNLNMSERSLSEAFNNKKRDNPRDMKDSFIKNQDQSNLDQKPDNYLRYVDIFSEFDNPIELNKRENVYFFNPDKQKVPEQFLVKSQICKGKVVMNYDGSLFNTKWGLKNSDFLPFTIKKKRPAIQMKDNFIDEAWVKKHLKKNYGHKSLGTLFQSRPKYSRSVKRKNVLDHKTMFKRSEKTKKKLKIIDNIYNEIRPIQNKNTDNENDFDKKTNMIQSAKKSSKRNKKYSHKLFNKKSKKIDKNVFINRRSSAKELSFQSRERKQRKNESFNEFQFNSRQRAYINVSPSKNGILRPNLIKNQHLLNSSANSSMIISEQIVPSENFEEKDESIDDLKLQSYSTNAIKKFQKGVRRISAINSLKSPQRILHKMKSIDSNIARNSSATISSKRASKLSLKNIPQLAEAESIVSSHNRDSAKISNKEGASFSKVSLKSGLKMDISSSKISNQQYLNNTSFSNENITKGLFILQSLASRNFKAQPFRCIYKSGLRDNKNPQYNDNDSMIKNLDHYPSETNRSSKLKSTRMKEKEEKTVFLKNHAIVTTIKDIVSQINFDGQVILEDQTGYISSLNIIVSVNHLSILEGIYSIQISCFYLEYQTHLSIPWDNFNIESLIEQINKGSAITDLITQYSQSVNNSCQQYFSKKSFGQFETNLVYRKNDIESNPEYSSRIMEISDYFRTNFQLERYSSGWALTKRPLLSRKVTEAKIQKIKNKINSSIGIQFFKNKDNGLLYQFLGLTKYAERPFKQASMFYLVRDLNHKTGCFYKMRKKLGHLKKINISSKPSKLKIFDQVSSVKFINSKNPKTSIGPIGIRRRRKNTNQAKRIIQFNKQKQKNYQSIQLNSIELSIPDNSNLSIEEDSLQEWSKEDPKSMMKKYETPKFENQKRLVYQKEIHFKAETDIKSPSMQELPRSSLYKSGKKTVVNKEMRLFSLCNHILGQKLIKYNGLYYFIWMEYTPISIEYSKELGVQSSIIFNFKLLNMQSYQVSTYPQNQKKLAAYKGFDLLKPQFIENGELPKHIIYKRLTWNGWKLLDKILEEMVIIKNDSLQIRQFPEQKPYKMSNKTKNRKNQYKSSFFRSNEELRNQRSSFSKILISKDRIYTKQNGIEIENQKYYGRIRNAGFEFSIKINIDASSKEVDIIIFDKLIYSVKRIHDQVVFMKIYSLVENLKFISNEEERISKLSMVFTLKRQINGRVPNIIGKFEPERRVEKENNPFFLKYVIFSDISNSWLNTFFVKNKTLLRCQISRVGVCDASITLIDNLDNDMRTKMVYLMIKVIPKMKRIKTFKLILNSSDILDIFGVDIKVVKWDDIKIMKLYKSLIGRLELIKTSIYSRLKIRSMGSKNTSKKQQMTHFYNSFDKRDITKSELGCDRFCQENLLEIEIIGSFVQFKQGNYTIITVKKHNILKRISIEFYWPRSNRLYVTHIYDLEKIETLGLNNIKDAITKLIVEKNSSSFQKYKEVLHNFEENDPKTVENVNEWLERAESQDKNIKLVSDSRKYYVRYHRWEYILSDSKFYQNNSHITVSIGDGQQVVLEKLYGGVISLFKQDDYWIEISLKDNRNISNHFLFFYPIDFKKTKNMEMYLRLYSYNKKPTINQKYDACQLFCHQIKQINGNRLSSFSREINTSWINLSDLRDLAMTLEKEITKNYSENYYKEWLRGQHNKTDFGVPDAFIKEKKLNELISLELFSHPGLSKKQDILLYRTMFTLNPKQLIMIFYSQISKTLVNIR